MNFSPKSVDDMVFQVETTAEFEREADAILDWLISQHAGDTGFRWFSSLREQLQSLSSLPTRCPIAPENTGSPFEIRHLLYGRKPHIYRILFTIQGETVYLLHIRHGRRLPLH
jgi:hypothetical protein